MKEFVLQRINELISHSKLSKNAFANKISMEQTTVNNQLIGKRGISIDLILNILLAFPEVSSEWLLRGEGRMIKNENNITRHDDMSREMTFYIDEDGFLKLKR